MKNGGIILAVLGILALIYGGINYSRDRTVLEMGSMHITATENKRIPIPAVAGVILLLGGVGLMAFGRRKPSIG